MKKRDREDCGGMDEQQIQHGVLESRLLPFGTFMLVKQPPAQISN
jgi:hypothetical protein